MLKKILRTIFTFVGVLIGYFIAQLILRVPQVVDIMHLSNTIGSIIFIVVFCIIFGLIPCIFFPKIYNAITSMLEYIERSMQKLSVSEIFYGFIGAIIALILMTLIAKPISGIDNVIGPILLILLNLLAAVVGVNVMIKRKNDIDSFIMNLRIPSIKEKKPKEEAKVENKVKEIPKVLDTSVIIDGRIFDICETGFVEGPLIISKAVLDELRHISDSSDSLKRNRGRRGLDILNKIQKELAIETVVVDDNYPKIKEVDSKLLKLAQDMQGKVITNDYNLNKVAEFQGVPVLNINELSNAVKPVVLPSEEMQAEIVKDGKESSQGVAYLDDGTMIVVEGGKKYIGEKKTVVVTSVLQTAAGRMIFAKPKE